MGQERGEKILQTERVDRRPVKIDGIDLEGDGDGEQLEGSTPARQKGNIY